MSIAQAYYASLFALWIIALAYTLAKMIRAAYRPRNRRVKQKPCIEIGFRANKPQEQR